MVGCHTTTAAAFSTGEPHTGECRLLWPPEQAYRDVITLEPVRPRSYFLYGVAAGQIGRQDEAEVRGSFATRLAGSSLFDELREAREGDGGGKRGGMI